MGSQGTDSPYMTRSPLVRSQRIHFADCADTKWIYFWRHFRWSRNHTSLW